MANYEISRYEEQGESLFICINSTTNPVYHEHFFTAEEKLDIKGTIERLVAELELKAAAYVAPLPRISKVEEAKAFVLDPLKIAKKKAAIIKAKKEAADKAVAEAAAKTTTVSPSSTIIVETTTIAPTTT